VADRTIILTAEGADGGPPLFACVDAGVRFVQPRIGDSRLMAVLAPFPDEEAARAALTAAGGVNVEGGKR
jgi:hypothetical protein